MDLYITITDENNDQLERVNIYKDGSDAEGAREIREWLELNYSTDPYCFWRTDHGHEGETS